MYVMYIGRYGGILIDSVNIIYIRSLNTLLIRSLEIPESGFAITIIDCIHIKKLFVYHPLSGRRCYLTFLTKLSYFSFYDS